ncbi:MAG TPA: glycosyltransferase family 2 protein [Pyrinomonadaceae bacterium]|nr:glycosyltransferase family 2 protein [Pyrinomonadaceae bacterium]
MTSELSTYVEIIFWTAVVAIVYTYAGYPLLLMLISRFRGKPVRRREFTPAVSVIIAAYNEEQDLATKLENTLALDYPKSKLEILVTSDCSTDRTDDIVRSFAPRGVKLHRQTERLGKTAAQNAAVEKATGEFLLFSDATTHYRPDVLRLLVRSFADESVGCVTGNVVYAHDADSTVSHGTRSYWNYEFLLKKHESAITSLIGVCGCMYAVRKSAYVPLYHEACSDFLMATTMVRQGLRAVYEPEAICVEEPNAKANKELAVRVRIITQTLADLWRNRDVLNPFRKGFYAVQLLSHKVMRYLVPLFLIVLLISSGVLAFKNLFYAAVFIAQIGFYLAAAASALLIRFGINSRLLALPQYFVITNIACLIALFKLLSGERYIKWEPVRERVVST